MPVMKLDAASCLIAQCEPGRAKTDYYDTKIRGFVLECRRSGGKTYYLSVSHGKSRRPIKIAAYGDISFDKAKKEAERLRSEFVLGGDPAAKKREAKAVPLFNALADQHEAYLRRARKRFGRMRLTDIRQQDVAAWLAELRHQGLAPATVLKTLVTMNRTFELGAQWGVPGADKNPLKGIQRPKVANARERYINSDEAGRLIAEAGTTRNKQLPALISLLLLCGPRVSELMSARWENVDIERRMWFIPTSKTGRSRHVPLSQAAIGIIEALPREADAVFLFPNPRNGKKHLTTIKHAWQTAREQAGLPDLRIHDLRHSAASFMINSGVDLFAVGKVLGHASYQSTQRYSHLANDTLLAAVEAGAAKLNLTAA
jgi:integrase